MELALSRSKSRNAKELQTNSPQRLYAEGKEIIYESNVSDSIVARNCFSRRWFPDTRRKIRYPSRNFFVFTTRSLHVFVLLFTSITSITLERF